MLTPERLDGLEALGRRTGQPVAPRLVAFVQTLLGDDPFHRRHVRTLPAGANSRPASTLALTSGQVHLPEDGEHRLRRAISWLQTGCHHPGNDAGNNGREQRHRNHGRNSDRGHGGDDPQSERSAQAADSNARRSAAEGEAASPRFRASPQGQATDQRTNGAHQGAHNRRTREHADDDETQESELSQRCGNHDGSDSSDRPLRRAVGASALALESVHIRLPEKGGSAN